MEMCKQFVDVIEKAQENILRLPFEDLRTSIYPVLIWGGGSLSVSVRKVLEANGVTVAGYLIDNANVKELYGLRVFSRDEIRKVYKKANLVIGHAKYELESEIAKEDFAASVVCLTDVCYGQWDRTPAEEIMKRLTDYVNVAEMLFDEKSVECLKAFLSCKISGRWQDIYPAVTHDTFFSNPFFDVKGEFFLDMGAYDGDTIREYLKTDREYKRIYAFEPEKENFEKLAQYVAVEGIDNIELSKTGGWNSKAELFFSETEESSSISEKKTGVSVPVDRMDSVLFGKRVTLIKINYFAGVVETLEGCGEILREQKPNIVITAGFDAFSLLEYIKIIRQLNSKYNFAFRFGSAMPARLFLYAF